MSIKFEGEVKINGLSEEKCGYLRLNIKNRETLFNQAETVFFFLECMHLSPVNFSGTASNGNG